MSLKCLPVGQRVYSHTLETSETCLQHRHNTVLLVPSPSFVLGLRSAAGGHPGDIFRGAQCSRTYDAVDCFYVRVPPWKMPADALLMAEDVYSLIMGHLLIKYVESLLSEVKGTHHFHEATLSAQ